MGALPQKNKASPPEPTGIASGPPLRLKPQSREQLRFLRGAECDGVQGYLLDRPMPWVVFANDLSPAAVI
ncbi:hypothetical protein DJ031_02520 [bacterium endosymbiont of Escarpia laminata]|nr:MAG: hypothetical protein DJ031_02520 [bacterium endosymbiont of Escarpia laminata]